MPSLGQMFAGDRFLQGYDSSRQRGMQDQSMQLQQMTSLAALMQQLQQQKALQQKAALEEKYRGAMSALPPNATEEQMLQAARPFQKPDQIGQQITASRDRQEAAKARAFQFMQSIEQKKEAEQRAHEAKLERMADQRSRDAEIARHNQVLERMTAVQQNATNEFRKQGIELRRDQMAQGNKPPVGYRWTPQGDLELIPGGPADAKAKGKEEGRGQITTMVDQLAAHYDSLEKMNAVVTPKQSSVKNVWERTAASGPGQTVAGFVGTKAQAIRDQIANSKPLLMAAIKQATGMSAQQLNSNAELQFYLQAATDPAKSLEANRAALAVLDQTYGMGTGVKASPSAVEAIRKSAPKQSGEAPNKPAGIKFLGFE